MENLIGTILLQDILVLQHNFQSDYFNNKYIEMQNKRLPNNKLSGEFRLKIFSYLYQKYKKTL